MAVTLVNGKLGKRVRQGPGERERVRQGSGERVRQGPGEIEKSVTCYPPML